MKLRNFLVVVSLLVSVTIGWVLSQRGDSDQAPGASHQTRIGLSMDTLKEERWQKDRDLFRDTARSLGADVLVEAANSDDARQIQDIQSLISNKVNVLVIVPHNGAAMAKGVELAHAAGIPVIAYDRMILNSDLDLYISFDNIKVGETQAKYALQLLKGKAKPRIVRIFGAETDPNAALFKQGQDNILKPLVEKGQLEIVHEDWAENWKPENAKKILQAAIARHGTNFDLVLAANDGTAGGAIQVLTEEGLAGKIPVIGQDAELAACQRIAKGIQSMTIYKPVKRLATKAAEIAVKMAQGKPVVATAELSNGKVQVPSVLLDVIPVTKDNLRETVIKDGFHTEKEVFGS